MHQAHQRHKLQIMKQKDEGPESKKMELDLSSDFESSDIETLSLEEAFNEGFDMFQSKLETLSPESLTLLQKNLADLST